MFGVVLFVIVVAGVFALLVVVLHFDFFSSGSFFEVAIGLDGVSAVSVHLSKMNYNIAMKLGSNKGE